MGFSEDTFVSCLGSGKDEAREKYDMYVQSGKWESW